MNEQNLHFEMNEAWILGEARRRARSREGKRMTMEEQLAGGARASWGGVPGADGLFHLDGPEMWFYPDGKPQYVVNWKMGRKTGVETYWSADGSKLWNRVSHGLGRAVDAVRARRQHHRTIAVERRTRAARTEALMDAKE